MYPDEVPTITAATQKMHQIHSPYNSSFQSNLEVVTEMQINLNLPPMIGLIVIEKNRFNQLSWKCHFALCQFKHQQDRHF